MRKFLNLLIYFLDCIIPKSDKQFVFASFPDISDNSYGMFKYIYNLYKNEEIKVIWLLSDVTKVESYKQIFVKEMDLLESHFEKIILVEKNSVYGLFYYMRSKYVFFTHGLYPQVKFPKTHILVNLWHGMPLKTIGYLDDPDKKDIPEATITIATSFFFQNYMAQAFQMKKESVVISGQPRNDILFETCNCFDKFRIDKQQYKKIFLWTPTYRQATIGYTKLDGAVFDGLPVLSEEYEELNNNLKNLNSYLIVKLHPMDILNKKTFNKYSNLLFLTNKDLEKHFCQLNQMLSEVDVLITDFSSVYIDFLLLNKPIAFVMDDLNKFRTSRGFVMENPNEYMPGPFISSKEELYKFLRQSVEEIDQYTVERQKVNNIFNDVKINFSEKLWKKILEKDATV